MTIREATAADAPALRALAERDSASLPGGPLVIGEVDGEIRAAMAVATGATIADPFQRTADVIALVHARAAQLRSRKRRRARLIARTPAPAPAAGPARLRTAA
ncbi:MAG TPA: hypothetical protein VHF58_02395 [Solirubrobacterales bacterium]|nr:hypothetical protein [Solirubrobacterales bacterium]